MQTIVYYLGVCLLIVHEMDAVMFAEWRLLFGLRDLPDASAYPAFLLLHVPTFFSVAMAFSTSQLYAERWLSSDR